MLYISSDHAGFELKAALLKFFQEQQISCEDCGALELNKLDDYPDFIIPCAEKVAANPNSFGIVIGGSGQGEAIAANKVKGDRAALWYGGPKEIITLSKEHNNANILSLGARFITIEEAKEAVNLWLKTKFSGEERHERRIAKINDYEER